MVDYQQCERSDPGERWRSWGREVWEDVTGVLIRMHDGTRNPIRADRYGRKWQRRTTCTTARRASREARRRNKQDYQEHLDQIAAKNEGPPWEGGPPPHPSKPFHHADRYPRPPSERPPAF